jgi:hypothetical protein
MNSWTITVQDAEDGSGDVILPLPDDLSGICRMERG